MAVLTGGALVCVALAALPHWPSGSARSGRESGPERCRSGGGCGGPGRPAW